MGNAAQMVAHRKRLGSGRRARLALSIVLTTALVVVVSILFRAKYAWCREADALVSRLNGTHRTDPEARERDVAALRDLLLGEDGADNVERLIRGSDLRERGLARFAITANGPLGCRIAQHCSDDLDESVAFQARLTLGRWPALAPLGTVPESRLQCLVAATRAFNYGVADFHDMNGAVGTLELEGPGSSRIVLSYREHGAHNLTETAFVFDAKGERVVERLVASDGSIRWILWRGIPAALVSEIYAESSLDGASELVGVIAVRHRLFPWHQGRFEERDTFYTPFVEKYP